MMLEIFRKKMTYYFDILFILACKSIPLISFNSLQPQLLFDVLCFKMDQVYPYSYQQQRKPKANQGQTTVVSP